MKYITSAYIIIWLLASGNINAQDGINIPDNRVILNGEWHFSGHVGQYIDNISEQRILSKINWEKIYPETEEAFRLREDDKNYPISGQWRGEFWGKYILSAIVASYYYDSDELKSRIEKAVKGLLSTQDDNGYIGTYTHSDFVVGNNWNIWGRKYTLWGLIEAWELLKDDYILEAAKRFFTHLSNEVGPGATDIVTTGNFYGLPSSSILQPVVKLYKATGDKDYLEYAEYIVGQWEKHPEGLPDILNKSFTDIPVHKWFPDTDPYKWAKAYEFLSCVEGLLELYEVTGNNRYLQSVKNIHAALVQWERSPIGNICFNDKHTGSAGIINTLSEICDAVYWNRLSFKLFELTGEAKYIEEMERTFYNSLLSAYNTEGTWGLRRTRMSHIHIPATNHFLQHHQCCTDNLPRGLFQFAETVLTRRDNQLLLAVFNEGEGNIILPSGEKVYVAVNGDFLEKGNTTIILSLDKPEKFEFLIRIPRWSSETTIKINGRKQEVNVSEDWIKITREWKNNDRIDLNFKLNVWWEKFISEKFTYDFHDKSFYDNEWSKFSYVRGNNEDLNRIYSHVKGLSPDDALPHRPAVTFFYGPIVLARDIRITEGDIFSPVQFQTEGQTVKIREVNAPRGIWKAYELKVSDSHKIKFCDFSSAGNTWNDDSQFNTWCILK